ncbi:UNKNOWN [Stylonychia lemnae]|uniref:Dynein axonemal assembly factor 5 TPR repeats domain-containing protein n=1 Tax=Stylonychia lemnae TaxID=5949 RepID=A0A078B2Z1_STYLE|nr:UNKNOWN [Stylonychia lemnae]|eukprot:CDW87607.1 UNKNOWN [Stylonychia lemnae]
MVESISATETYQEFEKRNARFLNMIQDNVKSTSFLNLIRIETFEDRVLMEEKLVKRLVIVLEDQIEKNREISIDIIQTMTEKLGLREESQILLPGIAARMNSIPYPETSEETRVLLIDLLTVCLKSDKYQFLPKLGEICSMLSKAALDPNPDMKVKAAQFAGLLSRQLIEKVGGYMKANIISMVKNLQHQHSKVRKATLLGLKDVIVSRGAEPFLDDAIVQLKFSMNDRSQDVRLTFYNEVLQHWLNSMEINSLKQYDATFVLFLLNGITDEYAEIQNKSIQLLEEHGKNMREALIQLGEEDQKMSDVEQSQ